VLLDSSVRDIAAAEGVIDAFGTGDDGGCGRPGPHGVARRGARQPPQSIGQPASGETIVCGSRKVWEGRAIILVQRT